MPPDDTEGVEDDDLPGLDDDPPSPEPDVPTDGLDDADLPGLDDDSPSPEPDVSEAPEVSLEDLAGETLEAAFHKMGIMDPLDSVEAKQDLQELATELSQQAIENARLPMRPRWPRIRIPIFLGIGVLGLVLAVGFFLSGDVDDGAVALPSEVPVEDTTPPSTEAVVEDEPAVAVDAPEAVVKDGPAAAVVPGVHSIDIEGEQVDLTVWRAPTATHVLVASPSLNGSPDNLAGFAGMLAGQGCANVLVFDSSQTSSYASTYLWIIDHFEDFGFAPDAPFSVFGSSATAAPALVAADERGGQEVMVLSPSDPPGFSWEEIVPRIDITYPIHVVAVGTTGDVQYRDRVGEWVAAGYEGYLVPGDNHGTPFFGEAAAEPVLAEFADRICGRRGGFHVSPADGAAEIEALYQMLNEAQAAEGAAAMAVLLHPAVYELYGSEQCATYVTNIVNPAVVFTPVEVLDFGGWQWERDGVITPLDDAFTVMVNVTVSGEDQGEVEAHIAYSGGALTWFTDCGDPLPGQ